MTFAEILQRPSAIKWAGKVVHEGFGMGCWHELPVAGGVERVGNCENCGQHFIAYYNPPYHKSLDAWIPVWEKIREDKDAELLYMGILIAHPDTRPLIACKPHHHLEAALRMLDVMCEKCEGSGEKCEKICPQPHYVRGKKCKHFGKPCSICTCTDGKINAYEHFMQRFGG